MTDGFRGLGASGAVTLLDTGALAAPVNLITPDLSGFASLELAFLYAGTPSGNAREFCQVELLWRDSPTAPTHIVWVDTFEFNSTNVSGFSGKQAFVKVPKQARYCQIVSANTGPGIPGSPTLAVTVYGSTQTVPNTIVWQDAENNICSDLTMLLVPGVAIPSGGSVGPFSSGLASGPMVFNAQIVWTTGGAAPGGVQFTFTIGSTSATLPPLVITQPSVGFALSVGTAVPNILLPRRPLSVTLTDTGLGGGHDTVSGYTFNLIRAEP